MNTTEQDRDCPSCGNSLNHDAEWHVMHFGFLAVLWLDNAIWMPHIKIQHHPVSAGYDESGEELYVAGVFFGDNAGPRAIQFCAVRKGAKSATFFGSDGVKRRTSRFYVLVLRYNHDIYQDKFRMDWAPFSA